MASGASEGLAVLGADIFDFPMGSKVENIESLRRIENKRALTSDACSSERLVSREVFFRQVKRNSKAEVSGASQQTRLKSDGCNTRSEVPRNVLACHPFSLISFDRQNEKFRILSIFYEHSTYLGILTN